MSVKTADYVYKEIGKRIAIARKARGMSQEHLASLSDIDRSHMGFIEQGRRRPTLTTILKLTKVLDITLEQMFKGL